jgi:hypothetical protein
MEDFQDLIKELEGIKAAQKALAEKEALCKEELMAVLKENGLDKKKVPMALCASSAELRRTMAGK